MTSVKTNKKGFTLVELVVVIAILAILAAIAIPVVNSIINTAARNGALSNAQTIELAVKECQAAIASKNDEVYDGETTVNGVTLHKASTEHGQINIEEVAAAKSIKNAFDQVTYNGSDFSPYWDNEKAKCVFIGVSGDYTGKYIDDVTGDDADGVGTTIVQLASTTDGETSFGDVKIDDLKVNSAA